ncbi:MAG TPA: DUF4440 domain-containing protein [Bacteroidales bacterium]
MKNKTNTMFSVLGIILFTLILNGCNTAPVDVSNQIMETNTAISEAVGAGDVDALTSFYTSDAKLLPANSAVIDGQQAISVFWAATIQMGINKVLFETSKAEKYGNIAIEEGNYQLFVGDGIVVDQGKYLVTWKNEGGKWKIYRDIWNANTPAPIQRAVANDTVLIVLNHVKADKVAQFEDFTINYLSPAGAEFNAKAKSTVRMQKPAEQNADGTYTYVYFMDPYVGNNNYDILYTLSAKYGEEKAQEYVNMYLDCLKDNKSQIFLETETAW